MLPSVIEPGDSLRSLQSILHAVAQMLTCNSANLAVVDDDRQSLVLAIGVTARSVETVAAVETALGFEVRGLEVPLHIENSLLVRALRERAPAAPGHHLAVLLLHADRAELPRGVEHVERGVGLQLGADDKDQHRRNHQRQHF